jgi:hypothetical protein
MKFWEIDRLNKMESFVEGKEYIELGEEVVD